MELIRSQKAELMIHATFRIRDFLKANKLVKATFVKFESKYNGPTKIKESKCIYLDVLRIHTAGDPDFPKPETAMIFRFS